MNIAATSMPAMSVSAADSRRSLARSPSMPLKAGTGTDSDRAQCLWGERCHNAQCMALRIDCRDGFVRSLQTHHLLEWLHGMYHVS